jgi:hypothetical protein
MPLNQDSPNIKHEIEFTPCLSRSSSTHCLAELLYQLGKAGTTVESLPPYLEEPLRELLWREVINHDGLDALLAFKTHQSPILFRNESRNHRHLKPAIELIPHITSRDNLAVTWCPACQESGSNSSEEAWHLPFQSTSWGERPVNELLFIRHVTMLQYPHDRQVEAVRKYISYAVIAKYEELKRIVEAGFEINEVNKIVTEENKDGFMVWSVYGSRELEDREKDAKWVREFSSAYGISLPEFESIINNPENRFASIGTVNTMKASKRLNSVAPKVTLEVLNTILDRLTKISEQQPSLLKQAKA